MVDALHQHHHTSHLNSASEHYVSEVKRISWIGLAGNLILSALKFAAGVLGNSQALVADAVHSLSDSITDISILIGVRFWSQPPDERHPHGHWRIESLVTVFIGLVVAAAAIGLAYRALTTFHQTEIYPPGRIALVAAIISIFANELLYRWTVSVGKRIKSAALIANAWHHRSDGFSSIPAAVAVAGAIIVPKWAYLDRIGALIVSVFILYAALDIVRPALEQLVDTAAPAEAGSQIGQVVMATAGVEEVHAIRTRHIGPGLQVDLHIRVDGSLTVEEGHDISENVRQRLIRKGPHVFDVLVHVEPREENQTLCRCSDHHLS